MNSRKFLQPIIGIITTLAASAFAQATFGFGNYTSTNTLDAPVFDAAGNRLFGTNYVALLYGGPTMDSLAVAKVGSSSMAPVPLTRTYNGQAGYFFRAGFVEIGNVPCAGTPWLQVRVWDVLLGATYEDVAVLGLGGYGESPLFRTQGGDGCSVTGLPPQPLYGLQSFSLVPEPSTWALLGIGVGFLLWRWRRSG